MAASNSNVATMTKSMSRVETALGTHRFRVADYSLHRGIGIGRFIRSATFTVGGHDWCIRFYPDGDQPADNPAGCVAFCLELVSSHTQARARVEFSLVDVTNGLRRYFRDLVPRVFDTMDSDGVDSTRGWMQVMTRSEFEASPYLRNDCLMIECSVTVIRGTRVVEDAMPGLPAAFKAQVTPSDLSCSLGKLLEGNRGADVTFKVKDELFPAHKIVLAMRSPVFDAQLFGPLAANPSQCITVEDVQPDVFRALLHFIYTDSLPAMNDVDARDNYEIVKHLLVAADKYGIERLKLTCESILGMSLLDAENVATTLALADQHNCRNLKEACIDLIASSNRTDDVVASQGYRHLKRACPSVLVDTWEKVVRYRQDKHAHP